MISPGVTFTPPATLAPAQQTTETGFWTAGIGVWVLWNAFTLAGALLGERLGDPTVWGLDGAAVAAFLGLLWPRLKGRDAHAIAIAAAFVTLVAVPFVPAGLPIIVAAVVSGAMAVAQHRRDA